MKKLLFTFTLALVATFAFATTHRVNNNNGNNNNANSATFYTTWAAAYAAAVANDTIILEPSPTTYSTTSVTITKKLTIIGGGFAGFIPAGVMLNASGSSLLSIVLGAGSSGSYITGLTLTTGSSSGGIIIAADDILVQRCRVGFIVFSATITTNNTIIRECYLEGDITALGAASNTNIIIKNNISRSYGVNVGANDVNIVIENNIFQWSGLSDNCNFNGANVAFNNNIMRGTLSNSINTAISNNICIGAANLPAGSGNQNSVTYAAIFNGTSPPGTDDARLKVGSVALGTGTGGNDIGAYNTFAGSSTYVQGGVPSFPTLYFFNIGGITNNILNVTVSGRANN